MIFRPVPAPEECAQEQLRSAPERIGAPATVAQLRALAGTRPRVPSPGQVTLACPPRAPGRNRVLIGNDAAQWRRLPVPDQLTGVQHQAKPA